MKRLLAIIALATMTVSASACVQPMTEKPGTPFCTEECEPDPDPVDRAKVEGTFIAGHLGSYWDCPDEAYQEDGSTEPAGADSVAPQGDAAPCADGEECAYPSSCETAQVTIRLTNSGAADATGILVDQIELYGTDDILRASLPLVTVTDADTNETFDGQLKAGEELRVRVEFAGPLDPYELLQPADSADADRAAGGAGIIHTTFSADNHDDVVVISGDIYSVPSIDT